MWRDSIRISICHSKGTFTYAQIKCLNMTNRFSEISQYLTCGTFCWPTAFVHCRTSYRSIRGATCQTKPGGWVSGGDIKYKNLPDVNEGNYDNVIDSNDRQYTGMPTTPEIVYGFGPFRKLQEVWFLFLLSGLQLVYLLWWMVSILFWCWRYTCVLQFIADDYWSETNQNIYAEYPRSSKRDNENNTKASTYWQRNSAFLSWKLRGRIQP